MVTVFDRLMVASVTGFVALGVSTLGLAVVGRATPLAVGLVAIALWGAALVGWGVNRPWWAVAGSGGQPRTWVVLAGMAVILVSTGHNLRHQGQYVITDRDSGIYVVAGKWIAEHGTLWVDSGVGDDVLAVDGVVVSGGGQTDTPVAGRVQIQGAHLFPSVMAVGEWVAGSRGASAVPALIGGLALSALFWLALRVVADWLAVAVVAAMAVDLAWLYTVRASLSEPLLMLLAMGGAALLVDAVGAWEERPQRLVVAGAVATAALTSRIDAGIVVMALPVALVWLVRRQGPGSRPWVALGWWSAGAAPMVVLALVDLTARSPRYLHDLRSEALSVAAVALIGWTVALVLAATGTVGGRRLVAPLEGWIRRHRNRIAAGVAVLIVAVAAFAWVVRPLLGPDRNHRGGQGWRIMEGLQANEGMEPDGKRTYAERSVERIAWYTGPAAIAAGAAGLAVVGYRLVRGGARPGEVVLVGLIVPYLVLYLYIPSVDADQPWFIRRYVPTAIPGLLVLAAVGAQAASSWRRWPKVAGRDVLGQGLAVAMAFSWVIFPARTTWPLRAATWQAGGRDGVERLCDQLTPDSVVVLASQDFLGLTLLPALRSNCDVEAVAVAPGRVGPDAARTVSGVFDAVGARSDHGGEVTVVATTEATVRELAPTARNLREVVILQTSQVVRTIGRAPDSVADHRLVVWVGTVDAPVP